MIEEAISGMDSTVAVASRSAYNFPSAGAISSVWPMNASFSCDKLRAELIDGQIGPEAGNGFELIERAAGMTERRGRKSSGPRRQPPPQSEPQSGWSCRRRRRWSAYRL